MDNREERIDLEELKVIELCSGIGAQVKGIKNTKLFSPNVVATADLDKEVVVSYASIHCGLTNKMIEGYEEYPAKAGGGSGNIPKVILREEIKDCYFSVEDGKENCLDRFYKYDEAFNYYLEDAKAREIFIFGKDDELIGCVISKNGYDNVSANEIIKVLDIPKEIINDNERQRRVYSCEGIAPSVLARTDSAKILVDGVVIIDD